MVSKLRSVWKQELDEQVRSLHTRQAELEAQLSASQADTAEARTAASVAEGKARNLAGSLAELKTQMAELENSSGAGVLAALARSTAASGKMLSQVMPNIIGHARNNM